MGVTLDVPSGESRSEPSPVADLLAGRTRQGNRYVIAKEIARGGMGAVVRAVDCDIRREVAIKYMLDDSDRGKKARFVEEAQITGQLEHPNIVPIHELGVDADKRLFFAMKMVKGRSLAQVLDELRSDPAAQKVWSLGRLLNLFSNICYAMAYAHSRGVIHRDLKPANIMLGDFGETYVMDWGLAKVLARKEPASESTAPMPQSSIENSAHAETANAGATTEESSGSVSGSTKVVTSRDVEGELTQDGAILGTPSYMAPEQARGDLQALDNRSDIYSLGAILYELLTLQSPVEKIGGHIGVLLRVVEGDIKRPEKRAPDRARTGKIPKELAAVAMKALALKPENRYQTVEKLRRDIERFQEGRSVSAKEDTPWEMAVKFVKRNKAFSGATGTAVVVLAGVLAVAFQVNYAARVRAEESQQKAEVSQKTAEENYASYLHEQKGKNDAIRNSIPGTLRAARQMANDGAVPEARAQIELVRTYEPNHAEASLLLGQILMAEGQWPAAAKELAVYLQQHPLDSDAASLHKLAVSSKTDDLAALFAVAEVLQRHRLFNLTARLLNDAPKLRDARRPLLELYNKQIRAVWPATSIKQLENGQFGLNLDMKDLTDLSPIGGMQLDILNLNGTEKLTDLEPLRGMPLTTLYMSTCTALRNLEPLRGMKLKHFTLYRVGQLNDLEPLRGMPLEIINMSDTQVSDLGPLEGMRLTQFHAINCPVSNLGPLRGMPLEVFKVNSMAIRDIEPLRGAPCVTLALDNCDLATLEPLRGMPCTRLSLTSCKGIEDLSPLRGMPCTFLYLYGCTKVKELEPLRGMPLTYIALGNTGVRDLTPLAESPLAEISFVIKNIDRGLDVLRGTTSLTKIHPGGATLPTAEFWRRYDAGEFKR